jgi:aryl-alcohol dehydrogenase-like predicted oxidoreductase
VSTEQLVGHATAEGTRRASDSFAEGVRVLGRTGLHCAPLGFSARRLAPDRAEHRRALADALRGGVSLVDVGAADGPGAELVAVVLAQLVQSGEVRRDGVIVVVELDVDAAHERSVIAQGLAKLGLERIDIALLAAGRQVGSIDEPAARDRWRRGLAALEHEATLGHIGAYGVAGDGLALPESAPDHISLADMLEIAHDLAGDAHRLAVARVPMNVLELGAATHRHARAGGRTTLQIAADADVGVIGVRPLSAEIEGRRIALASREPDDPVTAALAVLRRLEGAWADDLGRRIVTEDGRDNAVDLFRWGQELAAALPHISNDLGRWKSLRHDVIAPQVGHASAALLATLSGEPRAEFAAWWMQYGTGLHRAFDAIEARLAGEHSARAWPIALANALDPSLPEPWRTLSLARRVLLTVLSAPIACTCVTMRDPASVWDLLALREHPIRLLSAAAGPVDLPRLAARLAQVGAQAP